MSGMARSTTDTKTTVGQRTGGTQRRAATQARKASVLQAALSCFADLGIEGTTVHDIRRKADCSIGSIYHHFGSKEGVAEELFLDGVQKLNQGMLRKIRGCDNAAESVHAVVDYYCEWSSRNQPLALDPYSTLHLGAGDCRCQSAVGYALRHQHAGTGPHGPWQQRTAGAFPA